MRVVALVDFKDNEREIERKKGEEFEVTRERFDAINAVAPRHGLTAIVGEVVRKETAVKESPESRAKKAPAKRRSTRRKKAE